MTTKIYYLCDKLACKDKYNGPCPENHECFRTCDIAHAKNFKFYRHVIGKDGILEFYEEIEYKYYEC